MYAFEDVRDAVKISINKKKVENLFGYIESILEGAPASLAFERARIEEEEQKKKAIEERKIEEQQREQKEQEEKEKEIGFWEQKAREIIASMSEDEKKKILDGIPISPETISHNREALLIRVVANKLRREQKLKSNLK